MLLAGLFFRAFRDKIRQNIMAIEHKLGPKLFLFLFVVLLGLLSSLITAIIAALVLAEVITGLRLDKKTETKIVIVTCFSIGFGAALTPVGEPLATIAIAKLSGEPYHAGFMFLMKVDIASEDQILKYQTESSKTVIQEQFPHLIGAV